MKAIIDVDTLLIHAALAAQENYVIVTHTPTGRQKEFPTQTDFYGHHAKKNGGWLASTNLEREAKGLVVFDVNEFDVKQYTRLVAVDDVSPEVVVKGRFKQKIEAITSQEWCSDYVICFGRGKNFRYDVAQTQPYKQGRPEKPLLYNVVRDYMLHKYKDKLLVVDDIESDDAVAKLMFEAWVRSGKNHDKLDSVGVFVDKDLLQVPCLWFNFDKPEHGLTKITPLEAARNLAKQLLCGDQTDSIIGLPKLMPELCEKYKIRKTASIGATTADNLLKDVQTPKELFERVVEAYRAFYGDDKQPFTSFRGDVGERDWLDHMDEQFQLLRMRTSDKANPHVSVFLKSLGVRCE